MMDRAGELQGALLAPLPKGNLADPLLPPPQNPMAPPRGLVDALAAAGKHNADWLSTPGRVMQGVQPQTPGQWSEEDQFRANHLANQPYQFGPQTAFSEVFWPRTGTNVGGSGFTVGSGAMPPSRDKLHAIFGLDSRSDSTKQTDAALKAIDEALRLRTSGVPLVKDATAPKPPSMSYDEVQKAIADALKLGPK